MTLEIKHGFTSSKSDGTDATLIQPSHWNSAHSLVLTGPALVGRTTDTQGAAVEIALGTGLGLYGDTLSVTTTKSSLGLGSVDNTADSAKPVSTAQALADTAATAAAVAASAPVAHVGAGGTAHANAIAAGAAGFMTGSDKTKLDGISAGADVSPVTSVSGRTGAVTLSSEDVGLANANNTSDANKPVSTATQTALNLKLDASITGPTLLGKATAGAGSAGAITLGDGLAFSGTAIVQNPKSIAVATSRSIAATDFEAILLCASGTTVTLPNDTTLGISDAAYAPSIAVYAAGATVPTLTTTAVTMRGTAPTIAQYGMYGIVRIGANEWAYV